MDRTLPIPITEIPRALHHDDSDWPWLRNPKKNSEYGSSDISWPKISIVTPSFNQGRFIERTIRSVLLQDYPNLEYIIIDGGSNDQSVEIIKHYERFLTHWESKKDGGQCNAINRGFSLSTGTLLGWMNSDDYYLPGALQKLASAHIKHPDAGVVYGQGHAINESGQILYTPRLDQVTHENLFGWAFGADFMQPSCLFTAKAFKDCGPMDESINISLDVDLWLSISKKYKFHKMDDVLSIALRHEDAKTTALVNDMFVDLAFVYLKHGGIKPARELFEYQTRKLNAAQNALIRLKRDPWVRIREKIRKLLMQEHDGW